ncbi:MAG: sulfur carrier protein ThiS [Oligoflexia bacterium]|nr:sulfur carrier protein ThiS [Oligoflexia bacterium]
MELTLNGESRRVPAGWSIADLLDDLGLRREGVAVAVDMRVVPRSQHKQQHLSPGDRVDVITAVGGG